MPPRKKQRRRERFSVFLNIPYDPKFENLYLAYIAGLSAFGLVPRATLEIPTSQRRLDRILSLIEECAYSIHDLCRVQRDRKAPVTPRFNMPFELGLAVAQDSIYRRQRWYVCETLRHRVNKSLSDIDGTDVRIHGGTVRGVFAALCDVFVRRHRQPSVQRMYRYAFFTDFFNNFYNTDLLLGKRVSQQAVQSSWNVAAGASATASLACVPTWHEDFRKDLTRIDVPTLVIHGDADRILPIAASGLRTSKLIKGARLVVVKDGPHCITWTHADEVNPELVSFLGKGDAKHAASEPRKKAVA